MDEARFEKLEKPKDVWHDGVMVAGTHIVLKWELVENMARPQSLS